MKQINKLFVQMVKNLRFLSAVSIRLVKLTGKSDIPIHPKHLLSQYPWFLKYLKKTDIVLDLGCGNGQNDLKIAAKVARIIGVDKMIDPGLKVKNVTLIKGNLENKLDFSSRSFDTVCCLDVLEHLYNRDQFLKEIKRVMKPAGLLLLSLPNSQTSWKKLQRRFGVNSFTDPDHKVEFTKEEIQRLCLKVGFRIICLEPVTFDTPLAPIIDLCGGLSLWLYRAITAWRNTEAQKRPWESTGFRLACQK